MFDINSIRRSFLGVASSAWAENTAVPEGPLSGEIEAKKTIVIWSNYGPEGWRPQGFDSENKATEAIMNGNIYGEFVITTQLSLKIENPLKR